jgi:gliding motility-associated-like protein
VFFTEQSSGANFFKWDFGDGDTSNQANPRHLFNETRTYSVCLIAINTAGCSDMVCKPVTAKVLPLLDVPNAFTPGRFCENGIIRVAGYGIGRMDWRIYNRWGQLVFSTQYRRNGWDGTFRGKLRPIDVYTYTLDVEFTDGKKLRKTGDINLLR